MQKVTFDQIANSSFNAPAPETPGDKPPKETNYPDRTTLKPTPEKVPDPEETESADPTKPSLPEYGPLKRFSQAVGLLSEAGQKFFELQTAEGEDGNRYAAEEKSDARRNALDAVDFVRQTLQEA